jgi:hypothetical protein
VLPRCAQRRGARQRQRMTLAMRLKRALSHARTWSLASTSAPRSSSSCRQAAWPLAAAQCSAVLASALARSRSASASSSSRRHVRCPSCAA